MIRLVAAHAATSCRLYLPQARARGAAVEEPSMIPPAPKPKAPPIQTEMHRK